MTLSYPVWTPPAPVEAPRPALWSARRTALAIVAAVGIGSLTAVTVSYADTGSASTGSSKNGQFQRPGGGQFNGRPFGRPGNGQFGNGQPGQLGSTPHRLPGGP